MKYNRKSGMEPELAVSFTVQARQSTALTSRSEYQIAIFFACLTTILVGSATYILTLGGISSLDNDSYSYIDEAQWVLQHGFSGQLRPYTGNVPKPLPVLLYGGAYHIGSSFLGINALCIAISGLTIGMVYRIGSRLHSVTAGLFAATLTLIEWPLVEAAITANSSLFLLLFSLSAFYLSLRMDVGRKQVLLVCVLLCLGGLSRPEGWLIYLCAVVLYLRLAKRHPRLKPARSSLSFALLAPLVSPLIDRMCWGDWLYSLHSFQYFVKQFLISPASPSSLSYQLRAYIYTLWRLGDSAGSMVLLLVFAAIGLLRLCALPKRRPFAQIALGVALLLLCFHFNTYRQGFFVSRFVLVPLLALLMFFSVGVADTLARGWKTLIHEGQYWRIRKLAVALTLWNLLVVVTGGYLVRSALQTTYTETQRMRRLNRYMGSCVREINNYPSEAVRILMANAIYNPVRFHIRRAGEVHIDRVIEEMDSRLTGEAQLTQYDILCVGGRNPRNARVLDAVRRDMDRWDARHVDIGEPLYLYTRKTNDN